MPCGHATERATNAWIVVQPRASARVGSELAPHAVVKPARPWIRTSDGARKNSVGGDGEHAEWLIVSTDVGKLHVPPFTVMANSANSARSAKREVIHLNPLPPKPTHGRADDLLFAGQLEGDLPKLLRNGGTADPRGQGKLLLHLTDDRARDPFGRIGEPVMA